jgi:hypothetical protein
MLTRLVGASILTIGSVAVLISHETSSIFPWLPLALFGSGIILLVAEIPQHFRTLFATLSSSGYIAYVFAFASPSLIGRDPDKVAVAVSRVIEFEGIGGIANFYFYSAIPGFHLFVAAIGHALGIPAKQALVLLGICTPLFLVPGSVLLARGWSTKDAAKYASVIVMVATPVLYYGTRPIPQLLSVILLPSFLILFDGYIQKNTSSHFIGLLIVTVALLYSHKLPLVVVLGAALAAAGVEYIRKYWADSVRVKKYISLSVLFGILLALQQLWLTDFFGTVANLILPELFDDRVGAPGEVNIQGIQAVRLLPRTLEVAVGNIDWLVFTLFAGISWLVVLWWTRKNDVDHTVILGAATVSGLVVVLSYLAPTGIATRRIMLFAVVPFAATIGIALSALSRSIPNTGRGVVVSVMFIFIISQVSVTAAVPDHPYGTRGYLSPQEVDGKEWTNDHAAGMVAADFFYAREIVDYDRPGQTYITGPNAVSEGYIQVSERYLNATVSEQSYPYILYRPDYRRYTSTYAWRLTWNPEQTFDTSRNRVFDNGGSILYS